MFLEAIKKTFKKSPELWGGWIICNILVAIFSNWDLKWFIEYTSIVVGIYLIITPIVYFEMRSKKE